MWLRLQLLKAILQKKIHPQTSSTVATRRHLDWKLDEKEISECLEDALRDLDDDGAKWVKTDSDCKYYICTCSEFPPLFLKRAMHISFACQLTGFEVTVFMLFFLIFSYRA
jgi:hypothetical protein